MKNLSISQAYLVCALGDKGKLPAMSVEVPTCLVAASILELMLENCITITDKKVQIATPLPPALGHLQSLYDFIAEKGTITLSKLVSNYCATFTSKRLNTLLAAVGEAMVQQQLATQPHPGKPVFVPNKESEDNVVQQIRAELLEEGALSEEIVVLASLLNKSNLLKQYFSSYEKDCLKKRLKEIKEATAHTVIKALLDCVDELTIMVIIAAT